MGLDVFGDLGVGVYWDETFFDRCLVQYVLRTCYENARMTL